MNWNSIQTILIIGASARYIAQSAKIVGMNPLAVDLFSDRDLQDIADVRQVDRLSQISVTDLESLGTNAAGFLIGGGMEFRVEVLQQLKPVLTFFGPEPKQISQTQDPFVTRNCCDQNGISFPLIRDWQNLPGNDEQNWLLKPRLGSGGHGIKRWVSSLPASEKHFFQHHIEGTSYSAVFAHNGSATQLLGITLQLVGHQQFTSYPFAYCGSVGPLSFSNVLHQKVERIGEHIASYFELTGCFGIDFVIDKANEPWLIEINPRITASAEVLELSGRVESVAKVHIDTCRRAPFHQLNDSKSIVGKAIVFSKLDVVFTVSEEFSANLWAKKLFSLENMVREIEDFAVADIPVAGTAIPPGHPIVSVFCRGSTIEEVTSGLLAAAKTIQDQTKKLANLISAS